MHSAQSLIRFSFTRWFMYVSDVLLTTCHNLITNLIIVYNPVSITKFSSSHRQTWRPCQSTPFTREHFLPFPWSRCEINIHELSSTVDCLPFYAIKATAWVAPFISSHVSIATSTRWPVKSFFFSVLFTNIKDACDETLLACI